MSSRRHHRVAGALAGAAGALHQARPGATPLEVLLETLGGAGGGVASSALPDVLEPATSPNHRNVAHSVTAATTLAVSSRGAIARRRDVMRQRADELAAKRRLPTTTALTSAWYFLCECFYRLAAGALSGLVPGYLSHLLLDATTPRSIPLLARGF